MWIGLLVMGAMARFDVPRNDGFVLVDRGVAKSFIVLNSRPWPEDRRAAEILQGAILKMTGARLPIRTETEPPKKGGIKIEFDGVLDGTPGSFSIKTTKDGVHVQGSLKGQIYAVVDLLEKNFGCRYYSPKVQVFPKRSRLILPLGETTDQPRNSFRTINGDFTADPNWVDWLRLTTTDEMFGKGYYVHTFHRLVPPETYFASQPELYALVDGRRVRDQLCPSNPQNVEIAVETLKREMAAQPDKQVWSVSQNDNETYCRCPDCMKAIAEEGSPSGPILRYVNAVAKHFPDKTISTLAYLYSRHAPKLTKPRPNVQIMLCTIELSRTLPISQDPTSASFRDDLVNWGRICTEIYLWDYTVNFSHQIAPYPNLSVLAPNLKFFYENNARLQFQQTNTSLGHEFSELKSYLIAKLLWNPYADVKAIEDDFLTGYYGHAAPFIRTYIHTMEAELAKSKKRLDIYEPPTAHESNFLSASNVARYNRLFDQAEASVAGHPELLQRVKVARLPLDYAMICIGSDQMFGPRGFFDSTHGKPVLRPSMAQVLEEFHNTCTTNHVRSVNEANLSPTDFYTVQKRMLDLQIEGNHAFQKPVTAMPLPSPKYGHGDLKLLTNGVRGADDFRIQWLGWEAVDCDLTLDLGKPTHATEVAVDSICVPNSWILNPASVSCAVSVDGVNYLGVRTLVCDPELRAQPLVKTFAFRLSGKPIRFVRLHVEGTHQLPAWHSAAGSKSWFFLDELTVK